MISLYEENLLTYTDNIPKVKEKIRAIDAKIKGLKLVKRLLEGCIVSRPAECKVENALSELKQ